LDITCKTPKIPFNTLEGTIVKGDFRDIYYIQNQSRKKPKEIFNLFKFSLSNIVQLADPILYKVPKSEPLSLEFNNFPKFTLVYTTDTNVYFYLEGKKDC